MDSYINNKPAWIANYSHSVFGVMKEEELELMDKKEVQNIFHHWHIVVEDQFEPTLDFNKNGLRTLADLKKTVTLHG